ncbi:cellulose biosynthesis protein BcsO [Brenneria izadpanahii]|uniref:Cellulose biosynthesis protein BcsO n=1 Tax=Brenneria izadpanahii TaxID=2722756 RepID=A0ABX7UXY6_9GAMM|nr:cellulose biosynthesis protein BcsO [Brenneria izadpanahii]QTF09467.1 cellulose biosynthesis protein BcsO [Brenneria izadpanahii]
MNKYDDIKHFKEKLNLEQIDYKDTSENDVYIPSQEWSILRQVAGENGSDADNAAPLGKGGLAARPVPVNKEEFRSASLLQAVGQQLSAGQESTVQPAVAIERSPVPAAPRQPEPAAADAALNVDDKPRFRNLFRQKSAAVDENDKRRNTPLKPLLETIALCR